MQYLKLLISGVLYLFNQPALAEWQQLDSNDQMVIYLDIDNIEYIDQDRRKIQNLVDFYLPQVAHPNGSQITFQSFIRNIEVNCGTHRQKTLDIVFYKHTNARGEEVYRSQINADWSEIPRSAGNALLVDLACAPRTI